MFVCAKSTVIIGLVFCMFCLDFRVYPTNEKKEPNILKAALLTAIAVVHLNKISNKSGKFQSLMFPSDCSLKVDQSLGNI